MYCLSEIQVLTEYPSYFICWIHKSQLRVKQEFTTSYKEKMAELLLDIMNYQL